MQEIRLHGRGGQGAVTGAYLLGSAAFRQGLFAQAFPNFGVERTGAPVEAYVRLDQTPIRIREQIWSPDYLIIQDPTLVSLPQTFAGTDSSTIAILNSPTPPTEKIPFRGTLFVADGTSLALEVLGRPIYNTVMLGFFLGITKLLKLEHLLYAVKQVFPRKIQEPNLRLIKSAYTSSPTEPVKYGCLSRAAKSKPTTCPALTVSVPPASSTRNHTGTWRLNDPVFDYNTCIRCGKCSQVCPENCIAKTPKGPTPNLDYCKGCGLCSATCPVNAIQMQSLDSKKSSS